MPSYLTGRRRSIHKHGALRLSAGFAFTLGGYSADFWWVDYAEAGGFQPWFDITKISEDFRGTDWLIRYGGMVTTNPLYRLGPGGVLTRVDTVSGLFKVEVGRQTRHVPPTPYPLPDPPLPPVFEYIGFSVTGSTDARVDVAETIGFGEFIPPGANENILWEINGTTVYRVDIHYTSPSSGIGFYYGLTPPNVSAYSRNGYHGSLESITYLPWVPAEIAYLNAHLPDFAQGASAELPELFSGSPGMTNPNGSALSAACAYGGSGFGSVSVAAAPRGAGASYSGQATGGGGPIHHTTINGEMRVLGDEGARETQPADITAYFGVNASAQGIPGPGIPLPGTVGHFSITRSMGGYRVDSSFGGSAPGGTPYPPVQFHKTDGPAPEPSGYVPALGAQVRYAQEGNLGFPRHFAARWGKIWDALRLTQGAQADYDTSPKTLYNLFTGADGWSSNSGSNGLGGLSLVSGASVLHIVVPTGSAGASYRASRGFVYAWNAPAQPPVRVSTMAGYRYLTLRIRSIGEAGQPFRLTITAGGFGLGLFYWTGTTGAAGEWVERTFDLFHAQDTALSSVLGTAEGRRYYFTAPGMAFDGTMVLSGMAPGKTYEVDTIRGTRKSAPVVSFMDNAAHNHPQFFPLHAASDGLLSLSAPVYNPLNRSVWSIKEMAGFVNAGRPAPREPNGWQAAELTPNTKDPAGPPAALGAYPLAQFFENDQSATNLAGGGLMKKADGSYAGWLDKSTDDGGNINVPAQYSFGEVRLYPGCGDVMGMGAYGDSTTVEFSTVTRGQFIGSVVGESEDITAKELISGASSGTGTPKPKTGGYYATGAPHARVLSPLSLLPVAALVHRLTTKDGDGVTGYTGGLHPAAITHVDYAFLQRERYFVRWYTRGKRPGLRSLSDPVHGFFARLYKDAPTGNLLYRRTSFGMPDDPARWLPATVVWDAQAQGEPAQGAALIRNHSGRRRAMWGGAAGVWEAISDNFGDDWTEAILLIPDGTYPVYAKTRPDVGLLVLAAFVPTSDSGGGGTISISVREANEEDPAAIPAPFTAQYSTDGGASYTDLLIEPTGFDIVQGDEVQARFILSCTVSGEEAISEWESGDRCRTWTRLPDAP